MHYNYRQSRANKAFAPGRTNLIKRPEPFIITPMSPQLIHPSVEHLPDVKDLVINFGDLHSVNLVGLQLPSFDEPILMRVIPNPPSDCSFVPINSYDLDSPGIDKITPDIELWLYFLRSGMFIPS